ncbi:hypothetical protein [Rhodopirellula bahusiensis]|uniref:hypothetical protein n=1 Tax=Rhodopirellula bahusiensis TaxID=2014065 RepID=UPI0018ECCC31|nr:hypothetical protein [Rhodopirellula bahusiensis]
MSVGSERESFAMPRPQRCEQFDASEVGIALHKVAGTLQVRYKFGPSVELNPYESPTHCDAAKRLPPSRYPLLMLLAGIFGVASLGLALLIAVESINMAQRQGYDVEFTKGMIVAAGFAFLGSCWAFSCRLYWIRRPRLATVINLVAFGSSGLFWTLLELGVVP